MPLLKSIHKPTHLRNFAGQTLGVDAYGWLHRGTVACAIELAQGKPTRKHIEFALNRVRMLIHFGVKPYLVFDGDYLPSKAHTEKERAARRKESRKMGLELLRMGRVSQAHLELQKAVDVTPLMARELIEELKSMGVSYIVAPYEADSQMAYLEKQGVINGIISEDSDLLVFGAKCLLTKLDQHGECVMIRRADFTACREISLVGWTDKEFRMMAMLSGCDYLPGIDKMGLKTAYRLVRKHKTVDRVVRTVQFDGKRKVPSDYVESFTRAERTFLYQWVFCPTAKCLVNLNKLPAELDVAEMPFIGMPDDPEVAAGVAHGDLDPNTKQRLAAPSRQRLLQTRTRVVQTPDGKQGKSISEFFMPKRTPLAELDPNSFTPSPSQQRLLESQATSSWSASQVQTAHPPALRRIASMNAPSSAPQASRRAVSDQSPSVQQASPKRQRLCSDSLLAASMEGSVGLQTAASRFFGKQSTQASPLLRKSSRQKDNERFEVWSENTATEAAANVAVEEGAASSPKKRKKLAVLADTEPTDNPASQASASTSQSIISTTAASQASQVSRDGADTPATSSGSVFSAGLNASFADMKQKWAFNPTTPRSGVARSHTAPTISTKSHGINTALNRPQFHDAPVNAEEQHAAEHEAEKVEVSNSSPILAPTANAADESPEDEESPVPTKRNPTLDPLLSTKGSEDLLVPNSPASDADDGVQKPKLSLGRFAFAG